jgi:hypothetical protein
VGSEPTTLSMRVVNAFNPSTTATNLDLNEMILHILPIKFHLNFIWRDKPERFSVLQERYSVHGQEVFIFSLE